jgi:DNA-binding transcriptional LysR family regulator
MAVFAQVVQRGGFSPAARALGVSKATISKQIARLEERLGARLLNRTTRKLSLTDAGRGYFDACNRILQEVEDAERAVAQLQLQPRGNLRLSCPVSFGQRFLAAAVADFMAEHEGVSVEMVLADRFVDIVEERFDLAIRIAALPDSSLIARKLGPMRRYLCASPGYFARRLPPSHPNELSQHNCLLYSYEATGNKWRFRGPGGSLTTEVSGSLRANNGDVLRQAALQGVGVAYLPGFIVGPDIRCGNLEAVLTEWTESDAAIYAVYPHRRHVAAKVRAFVSFMGERFAKQDLEM